jgi:hypothetical protein
LVDHSLLASPKQLICDVGISRIETLIKIKLLALEGLIPILHDMRACAIIV